MLINTFLITYLFVDLFFGFVDISYTKVTNLQLYFCPCHNFKLTSLQTNMCRYYLYGSISVYIILNRIMKKASWKILNAQVSCFGMVYYCSVFKVLLFYFKLPLCVPLLVTLRNLSCHLLTTESLTRHANCAIVIEVITCIYFFHIGV